jgi:hypothetical protein
MAQASQSEPALFPGRGRRAGVLISWVLPYRGWELRQTLELDGDCFWAPTYFARRPDRDVVLPVSRFCFEPDQVRFEWLIDHHVEGDRMPQLAPWSGAEIDELIAIARDIPALRAA